MIVTALQDTETTAPVAPGGFLHHSAYKCIVLPLQKTAPVIFVIVETGRGGNHIGARFRQFFFNGFEIIAAASRGGVENFNIILAAQKVDIAVAKMQIKIKNECLFDLPLIF